MDEVKGKVCVTGAANEKKLAHLLRLQLVRSDLMDDDSFNNAIMGCEGVFHTASPVIKPSFDPKASSFLPFLIFNETIAFFYVARIRQLNTEILEPAVKGTVNVLRSYKKNPYLRRVVLTSSSSTVRARDDFEFKIPLDESSWSSIQLCETLQVT
ncbi:cellulose synthase-like protein D4-like [Hibiscus syriacus]|uniref:Cellulose synthase-like protein D4-like n=1 Tax=Hibiscus syriacus TaxID=106335 RepID=A0A6A2X0D2_HIBSY|nr:cellulose synthase-like protein D4-like [Hibiscus syriacus]